MYISNKWIKENLKQIFITDREADNDSQIEHTMNFLVALATLVKFDIGGFNEKSN